MAQDIFVNSLPCGTMLHGNTYDYEIIQMNDLKIITEEPGAF